MVLVRQALIIIGWNNVHIACGGEFACRWIRQRCQDGGRTNDEHLFYAEATPDLVYDVLKLLPIHVSQGVRSSLKIHRQMTTCDIGRALPIRAWRPESGSAGGPRLTKSGGPNPAKSTGW